MKTIEERAELNLMYEKDFCGHSLSDDMVCRAYVKGATEQKAIDDAQCVNQVLMGKGSSINYYEQGFHDAVERACEWLKERVQCGVHSQGAYRFVEEFRKAMEE